MVKNYIVSYNLSIGSKHDYVYSNYVYWKYVDNLLPNLFFFYNLLVKIRTNENDYKKKTCLMSYLKVCFSKKIKKHADCKMVVDECGKVLLYGLSPIKLVT